MSKSKFNPMFIVKEILDMRGVKWRNESPSDPQDQVNHHPLGLHCTVTMVRVHEITVSHAVEIAQHLSRDADVKRAGYKHVGVGFSGKGKGVNKYCLRVVVSKHSSYVEDLPFLAVKCKVGSNYCTDCLDKGVDIADPRMMMHPTYRFEKDTQSQLADYKKSSPAQTVPLEAIMVDLSEALGKHGVNTGWLVNLLKTNLGNVPRFVGPESLTMIVDAEEAKLIEAHRSEKARVRTTMAKAQKYFQVMADAAFVEAPDGLFRIMAVMDPTKGGGIKDPEGVCLEPNDSEAAERAKPGQFDMSWEHFIELFEATPSMKILGTQVLTVK